MRIAVDAMGATFFGIKPEELRFLEIANQKGFGEINLEKLEIDKRTL